MKQSPTRPSAAARPATALALALACCWSGPAEAQHLADYGDPQTASHVRAPLHRLRAGGAHEHFVWIQVGDSHTAGDLLTGSLRSGLQRALGDGGMGWVTPGYVKNQRSDQVKFRNSDGWKVSASNGAAREGSAGGFPFGGIAGEAAAGGAGFSLVFKQPKAELLKVTAVLKSKPAASVLLVNGTELRAGPEEGGGAWSLKTAFVHTTGEDWAVQAPLAGSTLGGLVLDRLEPGVRVDAMGINGSQLKTQSLWDDTFFADYLKWRKPNVVALAYGTNEAFDPKFDALEFENRIAATVRRIREVSQAAVLLLGLPDVADKRLEPPRKAARGRHSPPAQCPPQPLHGPAVRLALQRAAKMNHTLYWDWYGAMGQACSMARMARLPAPLAGPDLVHFTEEGYQKMGDILLRDVLGM